MRVTETGPGAGGGGDHFAPKYLVGNVLAGDPALAQGGAFRYFGDPGDGSGVAAALAAAAITPGDVWVRPGTYNFGIGAAVLPLTVPTGVVMRGAGAGLTIFATPASPSTRGGISIFLVNGEVRDIGVHLVNPTTANAALSLAAVVVTGTGTARRVDMFSDTVTTPNNLGALVAALQQQPGSLTEDIAMRLFPVAGNGGNPFVDLLVQAGGSPSSDLTRIIRPRTLGSNSGGTGNSGGAVAISVVQAHVLIVEPWLVDPSLGGIFVEADGVTWPDVQITDPYIVWRYSDVHTTGRNAIRVKAADDGGGHGGTVDSVRVTRGWFDNFSVLGTGSRAIVFTAGGAGGVVSTVKNCEVIGATCRNWDEAAHVAGTGISTVDANGVVDTDTGGAAINNVNDLNFRALGNW